MQLSKVTYALVAAGLIGGVATFYHQIDGSPVSRPPLRRPSPAAQAVDSRRRRRTSRTSPRSSTAPVPPS